MFSKYTAISCCHFPYALEKFNMTDNSDDNNGFASPPCFMHEIDPVYMGLSNSTDEKQKSDVARWRTSERKQLLANRLAVPVRSRRQMTAQIIENLEKVFGAVTGLTISFYWPFRAEPDLRPLIKMIEENGANCALPVVIEKGRPLVFRAWQTGHPLSPGVWDIPVPEETAEVVQPDIVLAPVVGFDQDGYRLGYGGGFFDRTLAEMTVKPRVLGVGYSMAAIRTIYPQWHDIPMDTIITESDILSPH
jgi:5,10-methenyltetrahydrofolate synthetase